MAEHVPCDSKRELIPVVTGIRHNTQRYCPITFHQKELSYRSLVLLSWQQVSIHNSSAHFRHRNLKFDFILNLSLLPSTLSGTRQMTYLEKNLPSNERHVAKIQNHPKTVLSAFKNNVTKFARDTVFQLVPWAHVSAIFATC